MTLEQFRRSLAAAGPPADTAPAIAALWWAAKGDWDRAHGIVMDDESPQAAWVHAYLHRVEGDLSNARYWYRQADRPVSTAPLTTEWEEIVGALL
jgi:hypothetical protein